jgi:FHS family glucose/mannose:H+ symporter-like MFS transporter
MIAATPYTMKPSIDLAKSDAVALRPDSDPPEISRRHSLHLWIWTATFALTGVASTLPGAILPTVSRIWHLEDSQSGLLLAALFAGSFLGTLLLSDHLRRTLVTGSCTAATGFFLFAASTNSRQGFLYAVGGLFLSGMGIGQLSSSINIIVGRSSSGGDRSKNLSLLAASWCIGAILSPVCAAAFGLAFGLHYRLALLALLCLLPLIALPAALPQAVQNVAHQVRLSRDTCTFIIFFFLSGGAEACFTGWLPLYSSRSGLASAVSSRWVVSFLWVGMAAGRVLLRLLSVRMDEWRFLRLTLLASAFVTVTLLFLRDLQFFTLGCLLLGLFLGPSFPLALSLMLGRSFPTRRVGFVLASCALGCAVLPALLGLTSDSFHSLRGAMLLPVAALLALALFAPALRQRT